MNCVLSKDERETIINFNDGDDMASIYTCNKALIRKLDGFCKKRPDVYKLIEKEEYSKTYSFPKKLAFPRAPRVQSQKQKEHLLEVGFKKKVKIK